MIHYYDYNEILGNARKDALIMSNDSKDVFISYRREDTAAYAGWLAQSLNEHFDEQQVFWDIHSIEPGLDFIETIQRKLDSSEVLISLIGKNWTTVTDANGRKRLQDPYDYVRMEITAALKRNIRVIPVLVQRASMPTTDELPEDMAPLTRRQAFELNESSWRDDIRRLIGSLDKVIGHRERQDNLVDPAFIAKAIEAAAPGDKIFVSPGVYKGGLVVDKPLEIIGQGDVDEIVVEADESHVLLFRTTRGRASNLTLKQTGDGKWFGVDIAQGRLTLEECNISSRGLSNVVIHGHANPILRRNRIHHSNQAGILIHDYSEGTLKNNHVFTNKHGGVVIREGGDPTLRGNHINKNRLAAVKVDYGGGGTIKDNDLSGNGSGAWDIPQLHYTASHIPLQRDGNKE